jgi:hypothetical protein
MTDGLSSQKTARFVRGKAERSGGIVSFATAKSEMA